MASPWTTVCEEEPAPCFVKLAVELLAAALELDSFDEEIAEEELSLDEEETAAQLEEIGVTSLEPGPARVGPANASMESRSAYAFSFVLTSVTLIV